MTPSVLDVPFSASIATSRGISGISYATVYSVCPSGEIARLEAEADKAEADAGSTATVPVSRSIRAISASLPARAKASCRPGAIAVE